MQLVAHLFTEHEWDDLEYVKRKLSLIIRTGQIQQQVFNAAHMHCPAPFTYTPVLHTHCAHLYYIRTSSTPVLQYLKCKLSLIIRTGQIQQQVFNSAHVHCPAPFTYTPVLHTCTSIEHTCITYVKRKLSLNQSINQSINISINPSINRLIDQNTCIERHM